MKSIQDCSTQEIIEALAAKLLAGETIVNKDGLVDKHGYIIRRFIGPIVSTDMVLYEELPDGKRKVYGIIRDTDEFKGRTCAIGGGVALYDSIENTIARHLLETLGIKTSDYTVDWAHPMVVNQFRPGGGGDFKPDAKKHSIGLAYPVKLTHGMPAKVQICENSFGIKEAGGIVCYSEESFPVGKNDEFAYDFYQTFHTVLFAK